MNPTVFQCFFQIEPNLNSSVGLEWNQTDPEPIFLSLCRTESTWGHFSAISVHRTKPEPENLGLFRTL